jgi:hypothetical protein
MPSTKPKRVSRRPSAKRVSRKPEAKTPTNDHELTRLAADIPRVTHRALRTRAAQEDTTIQRCVLRALHAQGYPVPDEFLLD